MNERKGNENGWYEKTRDALSKWKNLSPVGIV